MPQYFPENSKTGDFNPQRTLSGLFFVIPERLASIRVVALVFTANKQPNTLNYTIKIIDLCIIIHIRLWVMPFISHSAIPDHAMKD